MPTTQPTNNATVVKYAADGPLLAIHPIDNPISSASFTSPKPMPLGYTTWKTKRMAK